MTNKEKLDKRQILTIAFLILLFLFFIVTGSTGIAPGIKTGTEQDKPADRENGQ